jgi:hypothetical protein
VSDYVRFYALYKYGGVYLDTDMFVVKDFSNLLNTKFLIGYEDASEKFISGGIIASVEKHHLIEKIIDTYENLRFDKNNMPEIKYRKSSQTQCMRLVTGKILIFYLMIISIPIPSRNGKLIEILDHTRQKTPIVSIFGI